MTNEGLLLSSAGGVVCVDGRAGETIVTCIAPSSAVPGMIMTIAAGVGIISDNDAGTGEYWTGIALPRYDLDCDTAYTAADMMEVVIPKAGHRYVIKVLDPGAARPAGSGCVVSTTAGCCDISVVTVESYAMARITNDYVDALNYLFVEVVWSA